MKKVLLFFLTICALGKVEAQVTCTPNDMVPDTVVLFPLPYDPDVSPEGGITDTACVNSPFDFVFTVNVPTTFTFSGITVPLDSVVFATEGSIAFDPPLPSFSYACNPPNCVFPGGAAGCVVIYGTTTNTADIGDHQASFSGFIWVNAFGAPTFLPITFPDPANPIIPPGEYNLVVKPEGSENCDVAMSVDDLGRFFQIRNVPNPFSDWTQIEIESEVSGIFQFRVFDVFGKELYSERTRILEGNNTISFDGSRLPNGMYIYTLSDGKASVSKRMIISRR